MTTEQNTLLLKIARKTIEYYLDSRKTPTLTELELDWPFENELRATFVTLYLHKHLRGCMGEIFASFCLTNSVIHNAINAAFRDPRFSAVTLEELVQSRIEISILTPPEEVSSHEDIEIGKHGIILQKNDYRAVFLPHVATEFGWTLEQTLDHLCEKAGLSYGAWKEGARFLIFQAEKIEEQ